MKKRIYFLVAIFILSIVAIFTLVFSSIIQEKEASPIVSQLTLPAGFKIEIFAEDLGKSFVNYPGPNAGARMMEFHDDVLFVSVPKIGGVVALPDNDKDGKADEAIVVIEGLNNPHGIAFYQDFLYIANEDSLARVKINGLLADMKTLEYLSGLPKGGHWTRTIKILNDSVYLSIGSSCNACVEKDESRASIMKCSLLGKCKIFANGIRNAVGMVFWEGSLYATENSRDWLGNDIPPDEINIIKEGRHYGWPYCFGKGVEDSEFPGGNCNLREPSLIDLQAHSAPLGLAFGNGDNLPPGMRGDLFVAYHGSWNRDEKTGYKIVRIDLETQEVSDFATGWLRPDGSVIGRPVDVIFDKGGVMYVSDDTAGVIYRIWN